MKVAGVSGWRVGAPGRIRTCDPRLRRPMLYPTELRARALFSRSYKDRPSTAISECQLFRPLELVDFPHGLPEPLRNRGKGVSVSVVERDA